MKQTLLFLKIFLYFFSALAMESSPEFLDISCETSTENILRVLRSMGREDLEEYWKENNYRADESIDELFTDPNDESLSHDIDLIKKAKTHPSLRIAPQEELRKLGQANALGLFAGELIAKGQPIIEYVGQCKIIFVLVAIEPKIVGWLPTHLSIEEAGRTHYNFGFLDRHIAKELWQRAKTFAINPDDLVGVNVCIDPQKCGNVALFGVGAVHRAWSTSPPENRFNKAILLQA